MASQTIASLQKVSFARTSGAYPILQDITFDIFKGDKISLLGPNGCGKTTLLKILLGRLTATSGSVNIAPATTISYVDQELALFPWLSVKSNILFGLSRRKFPKDKMASMLIDLQSRISVEDILDKYPMRLSGGMRQRAVLARALIEIPDLMLLDEPFSALDSSTRSEVYNLFVNIDSTSLTVTHDPSEAVILSNRIILLSGGEGKPGRIMAELDNLNPAFRSKVESTIRVLLAQPSHK